MRPGRRRTVLVGAVAGTALLFTGCGGDRKADPTAEPGGNDGGGLNGEVIVSAAASLTDVFGELAESFTAEHPGARIELNLGSSGQLSTQIVEGAPADVAAFADTVPMDRLAQEGLLAGPAQVFATNRLTIVTPPGNPAGIDGVADLGGVRTLSLCVTSAPCGAYAERVLSVAGVEVDEGRVSRGQDVRATLGAVSRGDADAAIVYETDAVAAGDAVETVPLPDSSEVLAQYPIAVIAGITASEVSEAFVEHVRGTTGQRILRRAGFGAP